MYQDLRNELASALHICRNRKVHGYGPESPANRPGKSMWGEPPDWAARAAAILEFLTLIDFLEGNELVIDNQGYVQGQLRQRICAKYPDILKNPLYLPPRHLVSITAIDWSDFVLFTLRIAESEAAQFFHPKTRRALDRFDKALWTPPLVPEKVASGIVMQFDPRKGYGFLSPEDGSKDVFLPLHIVQAAGKQTLDVGQQVRFTCEERPKGPRVTKLFLI